MICTSVREKKANYLVMLPHLEKDFIVCNGTLS